LLAVAAGSVAQNSASAPSKSAERVPFTVYKEPDRDRHFAPSGQIGDATDITLVEDSPEKPKAGKHCTRVEYNAQASKSEQWAGIYWQWPDFNFGNVQDAGYNLRSARKLTFWVRGEKGGEKIEVKAGGIKGEYPDSFDLPLKKIDVTKNWKQYTLPLEDRDLSYDIGGFFVSFTKKDNPNGAVIYLDEIMYE